tara:strand:- start:8715 stop:9692 length:978 start_codon:yes stop_codon:yes gene_type:complete
MKKIKIGPHDVGGEKSSSISIVNEDMTYWEKYANALRIVVSSKNIITLDELRYVTEQLGDDYFKIDYFERNCLSLHNICLNKNIYDLETFEKIKKQKKIDFAIPIISLPDSTKITHMHDDKEHSHQQEDFQEDETGEGPPDYYYNTITIADIMIKKGLISENDIHIKIDQFDNVFPNRGKTVIAKAWTDNKYKEHLINNAKEAIRDIGIKLETFADIICMQQTEEVHHLVVCTLCSCYPRTLLGMPPSWYKSRSYRSRVVFEPRKVLEEFGTIVPNNKEIKVHDSNADMRYLILPPKPSNTDNWSESALANVVERDYLVGVRLPE